MRPGELYGFDSGDRTGPAADLIAVNTSKKLGEPCGRFNLILSARQPIAGYTWADLIPSYSLVEVYLQRYPQNPEPVLVMLGLTDARIEEEDYGQAAPIRQIRITGRELTCVFVDNKTFYLSAPPTPVEIESGMPVPNPTGRLAPKLGLPELLPPQYGPKAALFGMVIIDPELALAGEDPVEAINNFFQMVTVGRETDFNPGAIPLLNLSFPDAQFRDLLFFDFEKAKSKLFDPNATLPATNQLTNTGKPLWSLMSGYVDPTYQELFPVSRDPAQIPQSAVLSSMRLGPAVELVFRKKPFGGRINETGEVVETRPPAGSQFDIDFEATETIEITDAQVISRHLVRSSDNVQNLYFVQPADFGLDLLQKGFREIHTPLLDGDRNSPSFVRRFGLRLRQVQDYYLAKGEPRKQGAGLTSMDENARQRELLLWHWHRFEPLFRSGQIQLVGSPEVQVGKRLLHLNPRINREYYIEAVSHAMLLGTREPSFTTSLQVGRGWDLP